jgi:hypothetical protein
MAPFCRSVTKSLYSDTPWQTTFDSGAHEIWCEERERDRHIDLPHAAFLTCRDLPAITADEPVRYRRVQLFCGDKLLSEADNWHVPVRLTPEMNRLLDQTDTPFGRAVKDLEFQRLTLTATVPWRPLPEGWELEAAQQLQTQFEWNSPRRPFSLPRSRERFD